MSSPAALRCPAVCVPSKKKPFCDGLVYECIGIAEDMLRKAGKIE